jgi:hypothetical protein
MEHRLGLRRQVNRPAYLWVPGGVASLGEITSVSISGAFIAAPVSLPLLARIRIRLASLPGHKKVKVLLDAHVVRHDPGGFAVEWCEFAPGPVRALIRAHRATSLDRDSRTPPQEVEHQHARFR